MVYKTVRCWLDRPGQKLETIQEVLNMLSVVERVSQDLKQPLKGAFFQRDLEILRQFAREGPNGFEWHGPPEKAEIVVNLLELIPGVTAEIVQ